MAKEKFEEAYKKLEKIVTNMEAGDLPLEDSLKLYEEGMRLYTVCSQRLSEVQKRVELLTPSPEGLLSGSPFPGEPEVAANDEGLEG